MAQMIDSSNLTEVAALGEEYAKLPDTKEGKVRALRICDRAAKFNPVEMAYFCQQVASWCASHHKASAILTAFVNRLSWTPVD